MSAPSATHLSIRPSDAAFIARQGIGRIVTLTSTYDHRVIQGAQSGELLARIHELLLGEGDFYDEVFAALAIPYTPARWAIDDNPPVGSPRLGGEAGERVLA